MIKGPIEIINAFNIKYNNILSGASPGLNEYEISMYLTEAQTQIIDEYYSGTLGRKEYFESNERTRRKLAGLVKSVVAGTSADASSLKLPGNAWTVYRVSTPDKMLRILWETLIFKSDKWDHCTENVPWEIEACSFDQLDRDIRNPFRNPRLGKAFRIDIGGAPHIVTRKIVDSDGKIILPEYHYVYLEEPLPLLVSANPESSADPSSSDPNDYTICRVSQWEDVPTDRGLTINGTVERDYSSSADPILYEPSVLDVIIERAAILATRDYKENTFQNRLAIHSVTE
jgi:hypothetical protein